MARDFTVEEANNAVKQANELLIQYQEILNKKQEYWKQARDQIIDSARQDMFLEHARSEICEHVELDQFDERISETIHALSRYECCEEYAQEIRLMERKSKEITSAIDQLKPARGTLSWFFSGKDKKNDASRAYRLLNDILHSDYPSIVTDACVTVIGQEHISVQDGWKKFVAKRNLFAEAAETFKNYLPGNGTDLPEIRDIKRRAQELDTIWQTTDIEKNETQVKAAVNSYIAPKVIDLLKSVPIEELNRDRRGIRIKSLKDAGINTVADVHYATQHNLESIPGIGVDTAYTLKVRAETYAEEMRGGVKVQLSADDQNEKATVLVAALYAYLQKREGNKEFLTFIKQKGDDINNAYEQLDQYLGSFQWLFFEKTDKEAVIRAYKYLSETVTEEVVAQFRPLMLSDQSHPFSGRDAWNDFSSRPIEYYSALEEIIPGILGEETVYGLPEELAREIEEECFFPDGLKCSLRRYQEWGVKFALHQGKVLLGDEMGLGKTVQAIAEMVSLKNTGATHFVVICPASVLTNWCKEITEKSKLRVIKVHGAGRKQAIKTWINTGGVAVTTYETTSFFELEPDFRVSLLIVDEAHYIKNPDAIRTQNAQALAEHADRMLYMTGTALENRVNEMIALIRMLQPSIASNIENVSFMASAPVFRERVAPVYFRRKREDVLSELPELIETKEWCELSSREEEEYEKTLLSKNYAAVRQVSWNVSDDMNDSCKARRMKELVEEAEEDGRKVLIFSFFLNTIDKVRRYLGDRCMPAINGSVPPAKRQQIIDDFEKAPAGAVLPAQIQSGGTGLNIQSASVVIFCEPQFKPSIENQAISRAYRMGQSRNVLVYRLLCSDTVDEKIMDLLDEKQAIFDAFADKSVAGNEALELSDKNFGDIIKEEIERINAKYGNDPKASLKTTQDNATENEKEGTIKVMDSLDVPESSSLSPNEGETDQETNDTSLTKGIIKKIVYENEETAPISERDINRSEPLSSEQRRKVTTAGLAEVLGPYLNESGSIPEDCIDEVQDTLLREFQNLGCVVEDSSTGSRLVISIAGRRGIREIMAIEIQD